MREKLDILKDWILNSNNIVFFGGAGVSTESGIPDFRSKDGLYNKKNKYPLEVILSHDFFMEHTDEFYDYYKNNMIHLNALPNKAHNKLAELESQGKLKAIITQNIDGLHQKAGSKRVIELHGSVYRNYCLKCGKNMELSELLKRESTPLCHCGGIVRPDITLYDEALNKNALKASANFIEGADVLLVGGTSLGVYPAAGLLGYYSGAKFILINKSQTPYDKSANLVINGNLGDVLDNIN